MLYETNAVQFSERFPYALGTAQGHHPVTAPERDDRAAGPEAPRADRRRGRIGAATLRSLTVNHGAQRTTKPTAR